jgi:hypothetical protein
MGKGTAILMCIMILVPLSGTHRDIHYACSGQRGIHSPVDSAGRTVTCSEVTMADLVISRSTRWTPAVALLNHIRSEAAAASIDPRLLLAVVIRERGDSHTLDFLSRTPLRRVHEFSISLANMKPSAFAEARAYARGTLDYGWTAIEDDPAKAVRAAAYLLAKRTGQLSPDRSRRFSDAEYVRMGYRSGYAVMHRAEATGAYLPGVELFDLAYDAAARLLGEAGPAPSEGSCAAA